MEVRGEGNDGWLACREDLDGEFPLEKKFFFLNRMRKKVTVDESLELRKHSPSIQRFLAAAKQYKLHSKSPANQIFTSSIDVANVQEIIQRGF